jgi:hypothetical protein
VESRSPLACPCNLHTLRDGFPQLQGQLKVQDAGCEPLQLLNVQDGFSKAELELQGSHIVALGS